MCLSRNNSTGTTVTAHSSSVQQPGTSNPLRPIPAHPACAAALSEAQTRLRPSIFNHSFRVYLYAQRLLQQQQQEQEHSPSSFAPAVTNNDVLLFVACILHDIGTAASLASHPRRFEVAGADFAVDLLRKHGVGGMSDEISGDREEQEEEEEASTALKLRECWLAIAMHASPQIAEGAGGLVRLVRRAVLVDFGISEPVVTSLNQAFKNEVERQFPRLDVEKELGDAVVSHARTSTGKAPGGSWPGDLLRAAEEDPEWDGVNKAF